MMSKNHRWNANRVNLVSLWYVLRRPTNIRKHWTYWRQLQTRLSTHQMRLRSILVHSHRMRPKSPHLFLLLSKGVHRKRGAPGGLALGDYGPQLSVLRLLVPPQIDFPLEGPSAEVARKRLEPRVLPGVRDEVGGLTESLAADGALVWLFAWK